MVSNEFKLALRKNLGSLRGKSRDVQISIKDLMSEKSDLFSVDDVETYTAQQKTKQEILQEYALISTADNEDGSQEKHTGRMNYRRLYNNHVRAAVDTWYDLPFFTRSDRYGLISTLDLDEVDLVSISGVQMVNFVADAFNNVAREYKARANSPACCRGIGKNTMLSEIKAFKSYINEFEAQDEYLESLYSEFFSSVLFGLRNSNKIKVIDDFYKYLKVFLKDTNKPITTPGFMESKLGSIYMSGLVVDVLENSPDDDAAKIKFLEDPNFKIYKNLALKYGFKIDVNVPWRLIFDYRTSKFKKQISKWPNYREKYQQNLTPHASYSNFSTRYNGFSQTLVKFYHRFIGEFSTYDIRVKSTTRKFNRIVEVQKTMGSVVSVNKKYINWYAEIRNIERNWPMGRHKLELLKKRANHIYLHASKSNEMSTRANIAINYIEFTLGTIASRFHGKSLTSFKKDPILLLDMMKIPKRTVTNLSKSPEAKEDFSCGQSQGFKQCYFVQLPDDKFYWTSDPNGEMPQYWKDHYAAAAKNKK